MKTSCSFSPPESPPLIGEASECLPILDFIDTELTEKGARLWNASLKKETGNRGPAMSSLALQGCQAQLTMKLFVRVHPSWNSVSNLDPVFFRGQPWEYKKHIQRGMAHSVQ